MITLDQLRRIMPRCPKGRAGEYLPHLQQAMREFGISRGVERSAMFLAQLAHESGELQWMEELADGAAYEGRRDLGNVHPGDGRRYKGRGPLQLTGRANYELFGRLLKVDLVDHPELAASPAVGFRVAGLFWQRKGLNDLADQGNVREVTRRINGGLNGLAERTTYFRRALEVLRGENP